MQMLTTKEIDALAAIINEKVDLPFVNEKIEQVIFIDVVKITDQLLFEKLPPELYVLIKSTADGISIIEAEKLKLVLVERLNKSFDIPYLPEWVEKQIFDLLITLIVDAMRKGSSL